MQIKRINDYYDLVQKEFPDLERKELEKILQHGLKCFYLTNSYGADMLFKTNYYTMYIGQLFGDMKKF